MAQSSQRQQALDALGHRLESRFGELRETIRAELIASDQEHYVELAGRVHDSGDESVADLLRDVDLAIVNHHLAELREIDAALMRRARGIYGLCVDCDTEIVLERLEAYPEAARCHDCQARHERDFAHPAHPRL